LGVATPSARSYDVAMPENEQTEVRFLVGEWVDTRELADRLSQLRGEQDESEPEDD